MYIYSNVLYFIQMHVEWWTERTIKYTYDCHFVCGSYKYCGFHISYPGYPHVPKRSRISSGH